MESSQLRKAKLTDASVLGLQMAEYDAQGVEARNLRPIEAKLDKVDFSDADLTQTLFIEQDLSACTFNRAVLAECSRSIFARFNSAGPVPTE